MVRDVVVCACSSRLLRQERTGRSARATKPASRRGSGCLADGADTHSFRAGPFGSGLAGLAADSVVRVIV